MQTTRPQATHDFAAFLKQTRPVRPPLPPVLVEQFAMLAAVVRGGAGIGLVPQRYVAQELADGSLVPLLGYAHREPGAYYFATPTGRSASPACTAFMSWLLAAATIA